MSKELRDVYAVTYASVRRRRALGGKDLAPPLSDGPFFASLGLAHTTSGLPPPGRPAATPLTQVRVGKRARPTVAPLPAPK
jgi:hypothetical protein